MHPAIDTTDLTRDFGSFRAVDQLTFKVEAGRFYGFLGPNGAGKTTTIRMLATLIEPTAGTARVLGHDVVTDADAVRGSVSLTGQFASVDEELTGRENLQLIGRLMGFGRKPATSRADELLEAFGLSDAAEKLVSDYSGGMRRRLDIAASIVITPELLFLDEPTTGLDPRSRNQVWEIVRVLVAEGTTVLLTTQYLDEADQLADRVTVMGAGTVIAEGTSSELKSLLGGDRVIVTAGQGTDLSALAHLLTGTADENTREVTVEAGPAGGTAALLGVVRAIDGAGIEVDDVLLRRPTLDEVFLHLTADHAGGNK